MTLMERGIIFVVKEVQVDYTTPARYNDLIAIETELRPGRASLRFSHTIRRGGELLARAACNLACVGREGRPVRMPEDVKKSLMQ